MNAVRNGCIFSIYSLFIRKILDYEKDNTFNRK